MPADPTHPDQPGGEQRFRADLLDYLDSLPTHELADLLGELPSSRQEPLQLGVLMIALNGRLPDAYKLLPPAGHPGLGEGRHRTLREVVAERRAVRTSRHPDAPASGLAERLADRQQQAGRPARRARPCGRGGRATGGRGAAGPVATAGPRRRPGARHRP
jgi:hypothetical protein